MTFIITLDHGPQCACGQSIMYSSFNPSLPHPSVFLLVLLDLEPDIPISNPGLILWDWLCDPENAL